MTIFRTIILRKCRINLVLVFSTDDNSKVVVFFQFEPFLRYEIDIEQRRQRKVVKEISENVGTVESVAEMILKSKYLVAFTGAGISTESGISDFRGKDGIWTRKDKGLPPKQGKHFDEAEPNTAHLALLTLQELGFLKFLISQNVDNLHLQSGILPEKYTGVTGDSVTPKLNTICTVSIAVAEATSVIPRVLSLVITPLEGLKTNDTLVKSGKISFSVKAVGNLFTADVSVAITNSFH